MMKRAIIFLAFLTCAHGATRTWSKTVSLGDRGQWSGNKLPCPGQSILISEVAYVPDSFSFGSQTFLPYNGMLLFDDSGKISFDATEGCDDTAAVFQQQPFKEWYDPTNWKSHSPSLPHWHRVPCKYDIALFTTQTIFKLAINHLPVDISSLIINGYRIGSEKFRSIYSGGDGIEAEVGKMLIQVNQSVTVRQDDCPQSNEGCSCGRKPDEGRRICSLVECPYPALCSSPLKPQEHCCYDICGAVIHIEKPWDGLGVPFDMKKVQSDVDEYLRPPVSHHTRFFKNHYENVTFTVTRIDQAKYQIVFVDSSGNIEASQKAATKMAESLTKRYSKKYNFYIWTEYSGTGSPSSFNTGNVFATLFILGIIGAAIYLFVNNSTSPKLHSIRSIFVPKIQNFPIATVEGFVRFDNQNGSEIELGHNGEENTAANDAVSYKALMHQSGNFSKAEETRGAKGFANPLYNEKEGLFKSLHARKAENINNAEKSSGENPLYDIMVDITSQARDTDLPIKKPTESSTFSESKNEETDIESTGGNRSKNDSLDGLAAFDHNLGELDRVDHFTTKDKEDQEKDDNFIANDPLKSFDSPQSELEKFNSGSDEENEAISEDAEIDIDQEKPLVEI